MFPRLNLYFLTLVLIPFAMMFANVSEASPQRGAPGSESSHEETNEQPPDAYKENFLSVTPVGDPPSRIDEYSRSFSKSDYFYPYRQTLTPRVGLVFGIEDSSDEEDLMNMLLGFNWLMKKNSSPQREVGADLSLASQGFINVMQRRIYNERGSFRPYYKYGISHKFMPDEKFASFSNWENYLGRAAIGFEDIVRPPRSLRLELELAVGTEDIFVIFTYGYSFGW